MRINIYFNIAVLSSLCLHIYLLFLNFSNETPINKNNSNIEIILVNAKNNNVNNNAQLYANHTMLGGGADDNGHRQSPLEESDINYNGNALVEKEKKVLEKFEKIVKSDVKSLELSHLNLEQQQEIEETLEKIKRKQAEIEKNIQDYNMRPKKYFDGPDTNNHFAALYVNNWKDKVETWGNENYPDSAGKGEIIVTVEIDKKGRPILIQIQKSSGNTILDNAAIASIKKSGPFGEFSEQMKATMDILVLTRTWIYDDKGLITKNISI